MCIHVCPFLFHTFTTIHFPFYLNFCSIKASETCHYRSYCLIIMSQCMSMYCCSFLLSVTPIQSRPVGKTANHSQSSSLRDWAAGRHSSLFISCIPSSDPITSLSYTASLCDADLTIRLDFPLGLILLGLSD